MQRDIIVVGASAGGVDALQTLVAGLPANLTATILVVLHIPADPPSQLHTILARVSALPVRVARDGEQLLPGQIYVASADRHLLVEKGCIRLSRSPKENRMRPAIDVLFRSAAYSAGARVIGVVLTGMLDDGTAGLWAIKDRGGIAVVQAPADAQFASMPISALTHVDVDYTLPVAEMPAVLTRLTHDLMAPEDAPRMDASLNIETRIALEGNALRGGVMQLGPVSANTCPECHGVLVKVTEGPIIRFRCHTGHAYSLQTLLQGVNEEIDATLWAAIRACEERILLLEQMEANARRTNDLTLATQCVQQAANVVPHVQHLRKIVLDHHLFGLDPPLETPDSSPAAVHGVHR